MGVFGLRPKIRAKIRSKTKRNPNTDWKLRKEAPKMQGLKMQDMKLVDKLQDVKMQDLKLKDQVAGDEKGQC